MNEWNENYELGVEVRVGVKQRVLDLDLDLGTLEWGTGNREQGIVMDYSIYE